MECMSIWSFASTCNGEHLISALWVHKNAENVELKSRQLRLMYFQLYAYGSNDFRVAWIT